MITKVLRFCENCVWLVGWSIVYGMATIVCFAIGFAFWQLIIGVVN